MIRIAEETVGRFLSRIILDASAHASRRSGRRKANLTGTISPHSAASRSRAEVAPALVFFLLGRLTSAPTDFAKRSLR